MYNKGRGLENNGYGATRCSRAIKKCAAHTCQVREETVSILNMNSQ